MWLDLLQIKHTFGSFLELEVLPLPCLDTMAELLPCGSLSFVLDTSCTNLAVTKYIVSSLKGLVSRVVIR